MLTHPVDAGIFADGLNLINDFCQGADRLTKVEHQVCGLKSKNIIRDFANSLEAQWPASIAALAAEALELPFNKTRANAFRDAVDSARGTPGIESVAAAIALRHLIGELNLNSNQIRGLLRDRARSDGLSCHPLPLLIECPQCQADAPALVNLNFKGCFNYNLVSSWSMECQNCGHAESFSRGKIVGYGEWGDVDLAHLHNQLATALDKNSAGPYAQTRTLLFLTEVHDWLLQLETAMRTDVDHAVDGYSLMNESSMPPGNGTTILIYCRGSTELRTNVCNGLVHPRTYRGKFWQHLSGPSDDLFEEIPVRQLPCKAVEVLDVASHWRDELESIKTALQDALFVQSPLLVAMHLTSLASTGLTRGLLLPIVHTRSDLAPSEQALVARLRRVPATTPTATVARTTRAPLSRFLAERLQGMPVEESTFVALFDEYARQAISFEHDNNS